MPRYAEGTSVSSERSRGEIEKMLVRFGATRFQYGWDDKAALITFQLNNRVIRFTLPLPDRNDPEFAKTPAGRRTRGPEAAAAAWEAVTRQRFRALCLSIKAKLVAVEEGIAEFDDEFLANIVVPGGETVSRMVRAQIVDAYESKKAPKMLLLTHG